MYMVKSLIFIVFTIHSCFAISVCDVCLCRTKRIENVLEQIVDCSRNNVFTNYSFEITSDVYSLDLSSNDIDVLDRIPFLSSNTMRELFLNKNLLKEIGANVLNLPELKRLDLSFNELEIIHEDTFRNLRKLEYLNLANNKFTTFEKLAFHHLSNLKEIVLDNNDLGNSLRKINLFNFNGFGLTKNIKNISMRSVNLQKVPDNFFIEAYDMRKLIISNNNLNDTFEIPYTLEYLDMSDNPISYICEEDFNEMPALKVLKLNNLKIKEIQSYTFASLPGLKELELENNANLTAFSKFAFGREVLNDPFEFPLEKLSLKNSRLTTLDQELLSVFGELGRLDLQGNPWTCDCRIIWLRKLQIDPNDYEHLRCSNPQRLDNARIFNLNPKLLRCTIEKYHYIGLSIAVLFFCVLFALTALWFFVFLPRYQSRSTVVQSLYAPTTAYSVLPMGARFQDF